VQDSLPYARAIADELTARQVKTQHRRLLYTPEHGYASFTVPHFDRFMLRAVPDLVVPEFRNRRRP
jgi:hypothetical protein